MVYNGNSLCNGNSACLRGWRTLPWLQRVHVPGEEAWEEE